MAPNSRTEVDVRHARADALSNGRGEAPGPEVGADDVGLDQLIAKVGQRRLVPGLEAGRLVTGLARRPGRVARRAARLGIGLGRAAVGTSELQPEPGDRRFADPTWSESWLFRRMLQGYLVCADEAR